ncbi:hypothetical protein QBC39DRAFT_352777 [Podospora conica]|nr:hypothetical protein QBC39DRAFT_352777 [Schizothecium conicum]
MKSESLLALAIALFAAILTASPIPQTTSPTTIGTDGRSGYNSIPADPASAPPIEADGRSGYNAVPNDHVPRDGRSGYNGAASRVPMRRSTAPEAVTVLIETDGRSGYNGAPVTAEPGLSGAGGEGGVGTDGRSGYTGPAE